MAALLREGGGREEGRGLGLKGRRKEKGEGQKKGRERKEKRRGDRKTEKWGRRQEKSGGSAHQDGPQTTGYC
jgi:hypothetical protein